MSMHPDTLRRISCPAILLLILVVGCGRSRNREVAQGFITQFDRVVAQATAWDNLEKQAEQYNVELEKAFQEPNRIKRAKAFGVWITQYRVLLSQARSIVDAQSSLVDSMVSDSARLTGNVNRYARESTDALREYISAQRRGIEVGEQMVGAIESSADEPDSADPKRLEELTKTLEDLDSKGKEALQRAQDAIARLRAVAL